MKKEGREEKERASTKSPVGIYRSARNNYI